MLRLPSIVLASEMVWVVMKKPLKIVGIIIAMLVVIFLVVFALAKTKVVLINDWLVNRNTSTIGVDISAFQGDVDMKKLEEQGISFVYMKATEGSTYQDEKFSANWANAKEVSMPSGAYHFFSYDSTGAAQAENYMRTVGDDIAGRLIPAVVVDYYGDKEKNPPAKEDVVRELTAYLDAIEKQYGVKPIIYTRSDIFEKYLKGSFDNYPYWISSLYTPLDWNYHGDWHIWHYLNKGELKGYSGGDRYIDLDVLNKDKNLQDLLVK